MSVLYIKQLCSAVPEVMEHAKDRGWASECRVSLDRAGAIGFGGCHMNT